MPQQERLPASTQVSLDPCSYTQPEARAYKRGHGRGAGTELLLRVYTEWKVDPRSSTYVCLIVVKQGFDCRSSGKNLAGKSGVSASVLACNSAAPLPLGNWHMSGIRHTGNQATSLQITKKREQTVCYQIDSGIWDTVGEYY